MSIVRAHFEACGQDSWWDVDDESGQIVDCGPLRARWFWTRYVVILPIAVNEPPLVVLSPLDPDFDVDSDIKPLALNHRVVKIEPARQAA